MVESLTMFTTKQTWNHWKKKSDKLLSSTAINDQNSYLKLKRYKNDIIVDNDLESLFACNGFFNASMSMKYVR